MANLTKAVLTFDDGSTQEFDAAPVVAPVAPTEVVDVSAGESVEVVNTDATAPVDAGTVSS